MYHLKACTPTFNKLMVLSLSVDDYRYYFILFMQPAKIKVLNKKNNICEQKLMKTEREQQINKQNKLIIIISTR